MDRQQFNKVAREACKLQVSDKRLDEMWEQSERAIEAYKANYPERWAEEEERAAQQQGR